MENREKTVKLLESFLSDKQVDGVCGYIVDPDGEGPIQVIVVLDIDYIKEANTKPGFIARMIRQGVKQEIEKWIGFDVYVTSSTTKCDDLDTLSESMAPHVKRRLSSVKLLDELTTILDYEVSIKSFDNASDAVEEIIDILNERILDEIWETTNRKVSLAEKDELYWYLHNKFSKYIANKYNEEMESWNETKKKYVVTESQYKKLLNEETYENSEKDSIKFYKLFKRILDDKFSELTYDEHPFWSTHEDDVSWTDSEGDVITYNDYSFLVNRKFFWSLMEYLPISHHATKLMFTKYFKDRFPDKFFLSVDEFNV